MSKQSLAREKIHYNQNSLEEFDQDSLDEEQNETDSLDEKVDSLDEKIDSVDVKERAGLKVDTRNSRVAQRVWKPSGSQKSVRGKEARISGGRKQGCATNVEEQGKGTVHKSDRFFSAVDIMEETTPNNRGNTRKSKTKDRPIPLLGRTISRSERKKCSYLEQYKKKCSRKLKSAMKTTDLKDGSNTHTSPTSDRCSLSSSRSELSIQSVPSKEKSHLNGECSTEYGNTEQDIFHYQSICKDKRSQSAVIVNCIQSDVEKSHPFCKKSKTSTLPSGATHEPSRDGDLTRPGDLMGQGEQATHQETSVHKDELKLSGSSKSVDRKSTEKIAAQVQAVNASTPLPLVKTVVIVSNYDIPVRSISKNVYKKRSSQRHFLRPAKSPLQGATLSSGNEQQERKSSKPVSVKLPQQSSVLHPRVSRLDSAQKVAKMARKYITERKIKNGPETGNKTNEEISPKVQQDVETNRQSQDANEKSETRESSLSKIQQEPKNTHSEMTLPPLNQPVKPVRPSTCTNSTRYSGIPSALNRTGRKNYVELYQARKSSRMIPVVIPKPVPMLQPVRKSKTEEIKPVAVKTNVTKTGDVRPQSRPIKRYYLKKKPATADLLKQETEEDLVKLKILEEKKRNLQRQLHCIKSKSRSIKID